MQKQQDALLKISVYITILLFILTAFIPSPTVAEDSIDWHGYKEGTKLAQEKDKPVFIDFWAPWCGPCNKMDEEVYPQQEVIDKSEEFVCIKVNTNEQSELANNFSVSSIPTLIFFTPNGEKLLRKVGYRDKSELIADMEEALKKYEEKNVDLPDIEWMEYEEGRTKSKNTGKPVMIYFRKENSNDCDKMEENALQQVQVVEYANNDFVSIKVNATVRPALAKKHGIDLYPTLLFLYPDGSHLGISEGYASPPQLVGRMDTIIRKFEDTKDGGDSSNDDSPGLEVIGAAAVLITTALIVKKKD